MEVDEKELLRLQDDGCPHFPEVDSTEYDPMQIVYQENRKLKQEIRRLKWKLNHQTDEDAWRCFQGLHGDCGQ